MLLVFKRSKKHVIKNKKSKTGKAFAHSIILAIIAAGL